MSWIYSAEGVSFFAYYRREVGRKPPHHAPRGEGPTWWGSPPNMPSPKTVCVLWLDSLRVVRNANNLKISLLAKHIVKEQLETKQSHVSTTAGSCDENTLYF